LVPLKAVSVQNRPRPEYDPLGILLGAVRVSPQLTIGESYDDNIYATDTGKVGDRVTTLTGSVGVQSPGQRPSLAASGGFTSQTYARNSLENYLDWNGGVSVADGLGYRTSLSARATAARNHLAREDPSFPAIAVAPPGFDTRGALLEVRHDLARGNLDLNASFQSLSFNDAQLPQDVSLPQSFKDRNEVLLDLRGNFLVGPTTAAFLRVVHRALNYKRSTQASDFDRDATTDNLGGGATFQITNLMRGEIGIGVLHLKTHDAAQGNQTTLAYRSSLEIYLTQLMTATLTAERTTGPADIPGSSSFVGTTLTAGLDYELRRNLILSTSFSRFQRAYTGIAASETTSQGDVKARWLLNRSMTLNFGYTLSRRTSPLQTYLGQNYTEKVVEASVAFAL
jgi:hypothetical protein